MAQLTLEARQRNVLGKQVKRLRRAGIVPGNVYGHNIPSQAVEIPVKELQELVRQAGNSTIVELRVEGEPRPRPVLLRRLSLNPVTHQPVHVDLYQIRMDEAITAEVAVHFSGEAPAVREESAVVLPLLTHLRVRALPGNMPAAIGVDISGLAHVDDAIYVRDLHLPLGVEVLTPAEEMITKVNAARVAAEEVPAEIVAGPAEPPAETPAAAEG